VCKEEHDVLRHGPVVLMPTGEGGTVPAEWRWLAEVRGAGAVGEIAAGIVVPSARRAMVNVVRRAGWQIGHLASVLGLVVDHLFDQRGVHKVELRTEDTDVEILSAALQSGFTEEGRRRQCRIVDGHWRDRVRMGMLVSDRRRAGPAPHERFVPRTPEPVRPDMPPIRSPTADDFAVLRGEHVKLRRRRPSDRELMYRWGCCPDWWRLYMPEDPDGFAPPTREEFDAEWTGDARPNEWVIETDRHGPVGRCSYGNLDPVNRSADLGFLLNEARTWGHGYATDAARAVVRHLFEDLKLHRVHSGTWSGNIGSLRVQIKSGLRIESEGRECYLVDGKWYAGLGTGMLEHEFQAALGRRAPAP